MIYLFHCDDCHLEKDVVRPVKDYNIPEKCDYCASTMRKVFTPFLHHGAKPEFAEFNPAFGKVIKDKRHRKYEAEKAGMIEIGNQDTDSMDKVFDKQRADKREKNWNDALSEVC